MKPPRPQRALHRVHWARSERISGIELRVRKSIRAIPIQFLQTDFTPSTPRGSRTPDLTDRNRALCPAELLGYYRVETIPTITPP